MPKGKSLFIFVPLNANHQRDLFDCGEESLNRYLKQYASQHQKKNVGRVYVAVKAGAPRVFGYYTLANGSVAFQSVPKAKGLPREYPIPVILLARLAVDVTTQGTGLGAMLLLDALQRSFQVSNASAAYAVIVDALHEKARAFYEHYHFEASLDDPLRLFLPMHEIANFLQQVKLI